MSGPSALVVFRSLKDVTLMVAASMSATMMGASAVNRGYQYSERRGLEEQGRREESSPLHSTPDGKMRCGVLAGLRMCWSKHRYGHRRDLTLIVSCVSVSSGGGALVDWVSSSFFLWLRIRSIRMTLLAGALGRLHQQDDMLDIYKCLFLDTSY